MTINPEILTALAIFSVVTFIGSLIVIPMIIARLPEDYFLAEKHQVFSTENRNTLLIQIAKNILGLLFILAGIAMLVLPGQGILTILIGLGVSNFPGKYWLERKLVSHPKVFKSLNWIRKKAGVKPLLYPLDVDSGKKD